MRTRQGWHRCRMRPAAGTAPASPRSAHGPDIGPAWPRVRASINGLPLAILASFLLICLTPAAAAARGDEGPRIRPPLDSSSCGPRSVTCSVPIAAVPQIGAMWCVPAAASAIIGGVADQSYLARLMRTDERGTPFRRVPGALESFSEHRFEFSHGAASYRDANGLDATVRYQIGVLHRALILGVEGDLLPYWPVGVRGHHAVVVSGWRGPYLLVWDPLREPWNLHAGGFHLVPPEALVRAGLGNARAMVR